MQSPNPIVCLRANYVTVFYEIVTEMRVCRKFEAVVLIEAYAPERQVRQGCAKEWSALVGEQLCTAEDCDEKGTVRNHIHFQSSITIERTVQGL